MILRSASFLRDEPRKRKASKAAPKKAPQGRRTAPRAQSARELDALSVDLALSPRQIRTDALETDAAGDALAKRGDLEAAADMYVLADSTDKLELLARYAYDHLEDGLAARCRTYLEARKRHLARSRGNFFATPLELRPFLHDPNAQRVPSQPPEPRAARVPLGSMDGALAEINDRLYDEIRAAKAPSRMRVSRSPQFANEISVDQLQRLDPEGGPDGDWANPTLITLTIAPGGRLTRQQLTRQLMADYAETHDDASPAARRREEARIDQTLTNMVARGVLVERAGSVELNIDLR